VAESIAMAPPKGQKRKKTQADAEEKEPAPEVEEEGASGAKGKKDKAKKKKAAIAQAPESAGRAAGGGDDEQQPPKKKKKGTGGGAEKASDSKEGGDPLEDKRKTAQREIQQLVTRLRAEGKPEAEVRRAKQELQAKFGDLKKPNSKKEEKKKKWQEWLESSTGKEKQQEAKEYKHDLVVIPVVWRGRHDRLDVQKAAEDIKALVAQQGADVWVDSRRQYTPGQKFAHWEHRGVMLRIEVGPEDLEKGLCRVCKAKEPGEYKSVERKKVRLPPDGARKLLLTLKEWGLDMIQLQRLPRDDEEADEDEEELAAEAMAKQKEKAAGGDEDEDVGGNWAPRMAAKAEKENKAAKGKKKRR